MIATIDFETTGLKAGEDEVLQVSIIDENYNVLLNVYCRPNNKGSWEDAQAVHGITPLMVANELHSLKNGTVSFIYELDGKKRMRLIPWNELTKRSEKH